MLKASIVLCGHDFHLKSITEWKQVDYNFPNMQTRQEAIDKGWFIPQNVFPLDVDVDYIGLFGTNMIEIYF